MPSTTLQDFKESITLSPALIQLGERVDIHLTSQLEFVPLTLEVMIHYLEEEFTVGEGVRVTWETSGDLKIGKTSFIPEKTGSYLVRFGELFRSFSVVDDAYTICTITIPFANSHFPRGNLLDHYHPDVHARHLPVDYSVMITNDKSIDSDWDLHKTLYAFHVIYGDGIIPFIDGLSLHVFDHRYPDSYERTLQTLSNKEALEIIESIQSHWEALGYPPPAIIDFYNPGDSLLQAANQKDIHAIGGYHTRSINKATYNQTTPDAPLFFKDQNMIGFPWQLSYVFDESSILPTVLNPLSYTNHPDGLYKLIDQAIKGQKNILPVILNGDAPDIIELNRSVLDYLIEKTRTQKNIAFTRFSDLADYLLRLTPQKKMPGP